MTTTRLTVSADIIVCLSTGDEQRVRVDNIPCTWVWADCPRATAEYKVVLDWVVDTFGDDLETFSVVCVAGSPVA